MSRIDFAAIKNATEIWEIAASDDVAHNFHVHDVQFRVLALDGAVPPPEPFQLLRSIGSSHGHHFHRRAS